MLVEVSAAKSPGMIYVRGVAASSSRPANDPAFAYPVKYRPSCFVPCKANLAIRDGGSRSTTSFEVDLWPAGDLYCFSAELFDNDEESDFICDCVRAGYYGVHLSGELTQYRERHGYLDVNAFTPFTVFLQPLPGGEVQHAWAEEDGEVTYELQLGVFETMWDYYELTQLPEPNVNNYYANFGDGTSTYFQASRYGPRLATGGLGRGGGSVGPAGSDPCAPFDGDGGETA